MTDQPGRLPGEDSRARGKDRHELSSEETHAGVLQQISMEQELRAGILRGEFVLRYQPEVDSWSGRVVGVEALVRWNHPVRGLLAANAFIALAEESGLIVELDAWVLQTACRQASAWARSTVGPLSIAVNVSARDLHEGDGLLARVRRVLGETRLDPGLLELELTESAALQQRGEALSMLREIRALGVRIAIDDFGTGYSMLSRLQDFPFDTLKIDQSLVSRITTLAADSPIVSATVAMARGLGLEVVAEGVETEQQRVYLVGQGCERLQGYLISRPVEPERIPPMLRVPPLPPIEDPRRAALESAMSVVSTEPALEELVRGLLVELQRLTGLDSVYLTRIHWDRDEQEVLFSFNCGAITVPERLILPWPDTLYCSTLTEGLQHTDPVPVEFPQSRVATALGRQTSVKVPVLLGWSIFGTLCGASEPRVALAPPGLEVMRIFASIISHHLAAPTVPSLAAEGDQRDQVADRRDQAADQRDQAADQRDQAADQRDQAADQRDQAAELVRREAASERSHAEVDRDTALADRGAGARARTRAELDRTTARADPARQRGSEKTPPSFLTDVCTRLTTTS